MTTFNYPTSVELINIAQEKMTRLEAGRLGFKLLPTRDLDKAELEWEQQDNYTGLQQLRGYNGEPTRVARVGTKRYRMSPGVYGEFIPLDERELTLRRQQGTWDEVINVDDLVMSLQDQLLQRRLDRLELIIWTLLMTGTFSVIDPYGQIMHTDSYTPQTFSAVVPWATLATATPLADLRAMQLLSRGKGVKFDATATIYLNRTTANNLIANLNPADLYGRRTAGLGTFNSLAQINQLTLGEDLPQFEIYDETYFDSAGATQLFIPSAKMLVVGSRPAGQQIGEYLYTRNANNPGMKPGPYQKVIDRGENQVPRTLEVHDGHNGGPVLYFPGSLIIGSV